MPDPLPKNPTTVTFGSPDHDHPDVTGYDIDIIQASDGVKKETISKPKGEATLVDGKYRFTINVQPMKFGTYYDVVRTVTNTTATSPNSTQSNQWERSPGAPSNPVVA